MFLKASAATSTAHPLFQSMTSQRTQASHSLPKFRVAIVGGGIGGLCLAVALSKYADIRIDLYEAAEQFSEIGAGVMFWARTWKILSSLGMSSDLAQVAASPVTGSPGIGFQFRKSDTPEPGFRFALFAPPYGCIRFHRAHFLDIFVNHLPEGIAHFGKRVTSYTETDMGVHIHFADETSASCDLLVGCDGIRSIIRKHMFEKEATKGNPHLLQHVEPVWSGTMTYRALIPAQRLSEVCGREHRTMDNAMIYCGKSKHVVGYSIAKRTIVNIVAFTSNPAEEGKPYQGPWVTDCSRDEILRDFRDWEPEVQEMLKCIDKVQRWAIHHLTPLPFYVTERVALLGDSAHAMTPHQGAGAGQAIEDAYILASLLGHPSTTRGTIPQALKAYEHVRLPFANSIIHGSRMNGLMYEFNSEHGENYDTLGPALGAQWDWLWKSTPDEEVEMGLQFIKSQLRCVRKEFSKLRFFTTIYHCC